MSRHRKSLSFRPQNKTRSVNMVQITFSTQIGTDLTLSDKEIMIGMILNLGETIKIGIHNGVILDIQIEIQLHNRNTSDSRIRDSGSD